MIKGVGKYIQMIEIEIIFEFSYRKLSTYNE